MVSFISCHRNETSLQITDPADYNFFLKSTHNPTLDLALSEKEFWSKRLRPDSTGVGDLGPLANAYTSLFETTGNIEHLKNAEQLYLKAISIATHNNDIYIRSLSHNYIAQHRFKEAKILLEESYKGISDKHKTELLLFDVYMELGEYDKADVMLGKVKSANDYNYLIRLAKWNDYNGKLNAAIRNLKQAKERADASRNKQLQIWTYTNLADYYGHAGKIKESYNLYLKTLQIQPDNAYAKKKIAWILYSFEKNTVEAIRIIDSVMIVHHSPEYYLIKAELADFEGNEIEGKKQKNLFIAEISNENYEDLYNSSLIELFSETHPTKALELAKKEIKIRPTAATYQLLAYAQLKSGDKEKALETINTYVENKSFEPKVLYYSTLIYKVNGKDAQVKKYKKELEDLSFELGPLLSKYVAQF